MAALLRDLGRNFLHCHIDHFFDDFWIIEPSYSMVVALWSFREVASACGFVLDPAKSQMPAQ
eukprot:8174844-Karenia_brevis.AAC.1